MESKGISCPTAIPLFQTAIIPAPDYWKSHLTHFRVFLLAPHAHPLLSSVCFSFKRVACPFYCFTAEALYILGINVLFKAYSESWVCLLRCLSKWTPSSKYCCHLWLKNWLLRESEFLLQGHPINELQIQGLELGLSDLRKWTIPSVSFYAYFSIQNHALQFVETSYEYMCLLPARWGR